MQCISKADPVSGKSGAYFIVDRFAMFLGEGVVDCVLCDVTAGTHQHATSHVGLVDSSFT